MCNFADKNMQIMQRLYLICISLFTACYFYSVVGQAQAVPNSHNKRAPTLDSIRLISSSLRMDSILRVRDSLEVLLLHTTQTYQQVERVVSSLPHQSKYLDSLPSVLPVDLPIEKFRVSSPFGIRKHPIHQKLRFHGGVDVRAPLGMVVKATAPGIVRQVGYDPTLGAFVRLQHAFGFETVYGHLKGYCVRLGQHIGQNEQIGKVGRTGLTTGPHLHYTIKKNGSIVDPFQFCFLLRHRLWLYENSKT